MNELHLFAGAGGGILGGILCGHTTVCAVEIEPFCRRVLLQRQRDGILPQFPIWDDVTTFDGRPWRGLVDVVCGGFPCQDISPAGFGAGLEGARSGLWSQMARIICEIQPTFCFVENSSMLISRGLGIVLGELASMGYDAAWGVYGADDLGACHHRKRTWILAHSYKVRLQRTECEPRAPHQSLVRQTLQESKAPNHVLGCHLQNPNAYPFHGMDDGLAPRVDRLKSTGNGQFSAVAAFAFKTLHAQLMNRSQSHDQRTTPAHTF